MTIGLLRLWLRGEIARIGTQKEAAARWRVSETHLSDVLNGKREPGAKLLNQWGLCRQIAYIPKESRSGGNPDDTDRYP